jgi:hypothetical protein
MGEVVGDVGMATVEPSGRGLVAVALFGDVRVTIRTFGAAKQPSTAAGILGRDEDVADDADDAARLAVGAQFDGGVGEALGFEPIALVGRTSETPMMPQSPPEASIASST